MQQGKAPPYKKNAAVKAVHRLSVLLKKFEEASNIRLGSFLSKSGNCRGNFPLKEPTGGLFAAFSKHGPQVFKGECAVALVKTCKEQTKSCQDAARRYSPSLAFAPP